MYDFGEVYCGLELLCLFELDWDDFVVDYCCGGGIVGVKVDVDFYVGGLGWWLGGVYCVVRCLLV